MTEVLRRSDHLQFIFLPTQKGFSIKLPGCGWQSAPRDDRRELLRSWAMPPPVPPQRKPAPDNQGQLPIISATERPHRAYA